MKKQIALLLAATMAVVTIPMNIFAATDNSLSKAPTVLPEKTVLLETQQQGVSNVLDINDNVKYWASGTDFRAVLKDTVYPGDTFRVQLENSKWFFRSTDAVVAGTDFDNLKTSANTAVTPLTTNTINTVDWSGAALPNTSTYDTTRGIWYNSPNSTTGGQYYRYGLAAISGANTQVPYVLTVSDLDDSVATVEILGIDADADGTLDFASYGDTFEIDIPLVSLTTAADDVRVKITDSNLTSISTGTYLYGIASAALTNAYVNDPITSRTEFPIDKLIIRETRLNSIKSGTFQLAAPSGYEFNDLNAVKVAVESGLSWAGVGSGFGVVDTNYKLSYKDAGTSYEDRSVINVELIDITPSTQITGAVYFTGLQLTADDTAPWGDINIRIKNMGSTKVVTDQTIKAGSRVDWTVNLTAEGKIPELVNGRYVSDTAYKADDQYHQTARVIFEENSTNSWFSQRETRFVLPEGVKFRKVEIVETDNLTTQSATRIENVFEADANKMASVVVDGDTLTLNAIERQPDSRARIAMDIWVSVESGYEGDITLKAEGSSIIDDVPAVLIAKAVSPITVTTKVSDVKIGYQQFATADFEITETKAGMLMKNKELLASVSDMISTDMFFSPDTKVEVTEGDIRLSAINTSLSGYATQSSGSTLSLTGGTVGVTIRQASTKPSTIKFSNVKLKIDRTVPESSKPYQLVIWGTAVAENFGKNKDEFQKPGISTDYIRVVSSADDKSSVLTREVRVAEGENYYSVNGETIDMDAESYISSYSNSMMVPVRFVANAFGIRDDQILWDNDSKTATIIHPSRVLQFTAGSSTMSLGGTPVTMFSPDGLPVNAEIVNERLYIPFRALGDGFGVPVTWDESGRTAIYNEGADTSATAEQPAAESMLTGTEGETAAPTATSAPTNSSDMNSTESPTATPTVSPAA